MDLLPPSLPPSLPFLLSFFCPTTALPPHPQIPIEVRVPSYYGGNLSVHAFVTPAGGGFEQRVANAPELEVRERVRQGGMKR